MKKTLSLVLAIAMVITMFAGIAIPASAASSYTKATSIAVGDKVFMVCEEAAMELSTIGTYGTGAAYTGSISGVYPLEVVEGASEGTYGFKSAEGYLYWKEKNRIELNAELSANSSWSVSFDENGNTSISNAANADRVIWWNVNDPRFSTYEGKTANASYFAIQLYRELADGECGHADAVAEVTTPATCTTAGVTTWTCPCGVTWTTTIPATGHNYVDNVCTNCGDELQTEEPTEPEAPVELADGNYVIAAKVGDTYYAMSNTFASKITGTAITVTDGKVAGADAGNYYVVITAEEGGWTIKNADSYLKYNSGTNLAKSTEKYIWTLSAGNNGTWRVESQTSGRGLVFRASTYMQFGGYATSNATSSSNEYFDIELLPVEGTPAEPDLPEDPDPTVPTEPDPTVPTEPDPTEPSEPTEPETPVEIADGEYVIAAKVGEEYYAMPNTFASKMDGAAIVVTDGKVAAADAAAYKVSITAVDGGWTISSGENYLKYVSSTNLGSSADAYTWTFENGVNGTYRVSSSTEGRGLVFRAGTYMKFGGYSVSNVEPDDAEYFDIELLAIEGASTEPDVPEVPAEPTVVEGIKIGHTLNLASDISINFAVMTTLLAEYDSYYLECVLPTYAGNAVTGTTTVKVEPTVNGNYYYFTLTGVTAIQMNDMIEATLHMTKDGADFISTTDVYSVGTYAYSQLKKEGAAASLKALCADLLRYGAAAQTYKAYRTDALVDAAMTAEMKSYLSDIDAVTFNNNKEDLNDFENPSVTWVGRGLDLNSKVIVRFVFAINDSSIKAEELSARITYVDYDGKTQTVVVEDPILYNPTNNYYAFNFDSLLAAELRSVLSAVVYHGDTRLSCTTKYSVDTYGNGRQGDLLTLCKALIAYSDTAKSFFANQK